MSGYGHAQEYLMLQTVYPRVRPDIVVWQLTNNDVRDNVYLFDRRALVGGAKRSKPYYDPYADKMEMIYPGGWLLKHSRLYGFLFRGAIVIDDTYQLGILKKIETRRRPRGDNLRAFHERWLRVLEALLKKAMAEYPQTRFYGFSVNAELDTEYRNIFQGAGAVYLPAFYERVNRVEGTDCAPQDYHWTRLGHEVAGRVLVEFFRTEP